MSPKRRSEEEEEWPKRKAPMFNEIEAGRLISLYCENRDKYHGKWKPGGKSGESEKQLLLKQWTKEISSLGFANRTKDQIEEKIRNEVKKVQKYLKSEKDKHKCSKAGASSNMPRLAPYLDPLVELLSENHESHNEHVGIEVPNESDLNLDVREEYSGYQMDDVSFLFEKDRKPTQEELSALCANVEGRVTNQEEGILTSREHKGISKSKLATVKEEERAVDEFLNAAAFGRSLLMDRRSALLEEETRLAKMRQEEVAIRLEEAKILLELRKVELERAKLELERVRGLSTERYSRAPTPPATPRPYSAHYSSKKPFSDDDNQDFC